MPADRVHRAPSPEDQLQFLERIQRLLAEGRFTATYKFALIHAVADLCVTKGVEGSGDELVIDTDELADQFVALYLRQAKPFPTLSGKPKILLQNKGRQAKVVTVLKEPAEGYSGAEAAEVEDRSILVQIDETIRDQPLRYLQNVGGERLDFLYESRPTFRKGDIVLRRGVAFCFRAFYHLIVPLVRDQWERWIRHVNQDVLGDATDLHGFLFGSERAGLDSFRAALIGVQGSQCFYTDKPLPRPEVVDHFIPWSRYPVDLGHNFVLTSASTNSSKSDHLASEEFLERWLCFLVERRNDLDAAFRKAGVAHSLHASLRIAEWSYGGLERSHGRVWLPTGETQPLTGNWRRHFKWATNELGFS